MATMQGVYITVLGMAILFAALLILMLAAMGLDRLFRPKKLGEKPPLQREKGLVAAIAVAISLELKAQSSKLQYPISNTQCKTSEGLLSSWKLGGRHRQLMSSQEVKRCRQ
jgi:Na+-transporting methylmalonyl-CoA/oxaloacetate decarboxylase gamma subunit